MLKRAYSETPRSPMHGLPNLYNPTLPPLKIRGGKEGLIAVMCI